MLKNKFTWLAAIILVIIVIVALLAREKAYRVTLLSNQSFSVPAGDYKAMSFKN